MITVRMVKGNPILNHSRKVSRKPYLALIPAATTPALEPIKVRLPPRSAPRARAHHNGLIDMCPNPAIISGLLINVSNSGTIVTVKGILSTKPLAIADNQITEKNVDHGSPPVTPSTAEESISYSTGL